MKTKFKISNRILSLVLALVMVVGLLPMTNFTAFAATTPTPYDGVSVTPTKITSSNYHQFGLTGDNWSSYNGHYAIRNAKELYGFAALVNGGTNTANAVLLQDIVVNETVSASGAAYSWTPIGTDSAPFLGTFDGNGCTVSGIYINGSGNNVGLFGEVGYCTNKRAEGTAIIKNVILSDSYIKGNQNVAGIVGELNGDYVTVSKCKVDSSVSIYATHESEPYVGGISGGFGMAMLGVDSVCTVSDCVSLATIQSVNADDYVGAVVGFWRQKYNAMEFVVCNNCYYLNGCTTDKNGKTLGGTGGYGDIYGWCTALNSIHDSHTCVSVEHKEIKATCQYPGLSAYSACMICGQITAGTKTVENITDHLYQGATCNKNGVCHYCGIADGPKDENNHQDWAGSYTYSAVEGDTTKHDVRYPCCGTYIKAEPHSYSNGVCVNCKINCSHSFDSAGFCTNGCYQPATRNEDAESAYYGYYEIYNAGQLFWFAQQVNNGNNTINAVLTADINLETLPWEAMGQQSAPYTGTFDGQGYTISNMSRNTGLNEGTRASFIYYLGEDGCIRNVTFDYADVFTQGHANANASAVVALRNSGTIESVVVSNSLVQLGAYSYLAGIAGVNESSGVIKNCAVLNTYLNRRFSQNKPGGGIVYNNLGTVENCYAYGCSYGVANESNGGIIVEGNAPVNSYYYTTSTVAAADYAKAAETFASGEIAYLLNGLTSEGDLVWGQLIGTDSYPTSGGSRVYYGYKSCAEDEQAVYTNDSTVVAEKPAHTSDTATCAVSAVCEGCNAEYKDFTNHDSAVPFDEKGFCENGCYQPAELNADGDYEINNAGRLFWFAQQVNNGNNTINAVLTADIDLETLPWEAMGQQSAPYTGTFDGQGYTISNMSRNTGLNEGTRASFIYYLGEDGCIRNVTFDYADVFTQGHANANASAVVALRNSGTIESVVVSNSRVQLGAYSYLAGIAGVNESSGVIKNCAVLNTSLNRRFSQNKPGGGIVYNNLGTVENCYAYGCSYGTANESNGGIIVEGNVPVNSYYYTTSTVATADYAKTAEVFASGEVAYLLNGSTSEGDLVWGQLIGTDSYPVLGGETVYYSEAKGYSNTLHTCDFSGEWKYDSEKHWKECTDTDCEEKSEEVTHSYKDGACSCGYECPHESYTDGVCDNCGYACTHSWDEGVLTRPVHDLVLGSKDGYYTYTCSLCGDKKTEAVKSADYSAYEDISDIINGYLSSDELTNEAKQAIYSAANECGLLPDNLMESEQAIVDELVAELQKIIDDADEKVASGEYVKADYTEIDEVIASVNEALEDATINDEMKAELEDIKADLEALKADANTSAADLANSGLLARVEAIAETMNNCANGVHSFTTYEEVTAPECGKAGLEKATCDNGCGESDEKEIPALEHNFADYTSNSDATCTADGTKTAECVLGCGETDTVADEGSMIDHLDEDGDNLCDGCGEELTCKDCGRPVHEETGIPQYICLIITLIRLIISFLNAVK